MCARSNSEHLGTVTWHSCMLSLPTLKIYHKVATNLMTECQQPDGDAEFMNRQASIVSLAVCLCNRQWQWLVWHHKHKFINSHWQEDETMTSTCSEFCVCTMVCSLKKSLYRVKAALLFRASALDLPHNWPFLEGVFAKAKTAYGNILNTKSALIHKS